jgi:hypothetical protein
MRGVHDFIKEHSQNAILGALIASALALVGSVVSVYMTYHYAIVAQDRQVRLEQLSKFDASSSQIVEAAGSFINAINDNKDLLSAKQKLSAILATQIHDTEGFRILYGKKIDTLVGNYQTAIIELNQAAQKTLSVTEMRPWTESFGRVLDAKTNLIRGLYSEAGVRKRADDV